MWAGSDNNGGDDVDVDGAGDADDISNTDKSKLRSRKVKSAHVRAGLWGRCKELIRIGHMALVIPPGATPKGIAVPGCPQVHSSIPLSCIRAVERVDEGAFQLPHVMQVVTQDGTGVPHTTYLQCKVGLSAQSGVGTVTQPHSRSDCRLPLAECE